MKHCTHYNRKDVFDQNYKQAPLTIIYLLSECKKKKRKRKDLAALKKRLAIHETLFLKEDILKSKSN